MYLVGSEGGYPAQDELWGYLEDGLVQIHETNELECRRMRVLMRQYRDTPMDLADASLVVAAEVLNVTLIFTIDSDFRVYRIHRKTPFEIIP
jgi:predicted nucleic acid-binding protein